MLLALVGAWPFEASIRRALRYDGLIPTIRDGGGMRQPTPLELPDIVKGISERRDDSSPFDIVVEGTTSTSDRDRAVEKVRPWAEAGATWYLEARWGVKEGADAIEQFQRRIAAGPPRID